MSLLTVEKDELYELLCSKLLQNSEIQFVGVVNKKGRIIAGRFGNDEFTKFDENYGLDVFLMETALEFSMKNEFNNKFGKMEYVFSKRNSANITCIPIHENILVIITESNFEIHKIIEKYTPDIQKIREEIDFDESL